ncbi:MAG: Crp/Fnr family transcriptional regulator [Myxococcota bacterium]|mgnify:CR=1 FL=1
MAYAIPLSRPAPAPDRLSVLRTLSFFRGLDEGALADLARRLSVRERPEGAVLVDEDLPTDALFVIETGRARIVREGEDGRAVTLGTLRAGDVFGEVAPLDGLPRAASVVAATQVRLLAIGRAALLEHLRAHPITALRLLSELSRRLRRADETITDLALCSVDERLARTLVALAREDGVDGPEGLILRARPTQAELASMVGTCRETVSRAIAAWQRRGWVTAKGRMLSLSRDLLAMAEPRRHAA